LADLDSLDWPEHVLAMQRNWIGRSEGVEFDMRVAGGPGRCFAVYSTRPDTIYGMTFAVLAPEHPLVGRIVAPERQAAVRAYCERAVLRSDIDRLQSGRDGVFTGRYALGPVDDAHVPIYVADYVLMSHGSGAIMGVPAHDVRDFEFASRHGIPRPVVVAPPGLDGEPGVWASAPHTGPGTMVNSGPWDGLPSEEAKERIVDWMEAHGTGRRRVHYRMRDWLISRQRFWGTPIPIVYCEQCGIQPLPEEELPLLLPQIDSWQPGEGGRSPLANVPGFVNTICPRCGGAAQRETDTLDGFACSSWYYMRFVSPHYDEGPFDPAALARWGAPDLYVGGSEHAVMHLLYARFWAKALADAGIVPYREPFPVLRSQGVMHALDATSGQARRMSKSSGNVVTLDEMAETHGADALRIHLLFMAPFDGNTIWEEEGIVGSKRFLERTWRLAARVVGFVRSMAQAPSTEWEGTWGSETGVPRSGDELTVELHRTIERVTHDIREFKFNTAVAALMECLRHMIAHQRAKGTTVELARVTRTYVRLLAPFAPYIAEELWARLGGSYSVHQQGWPAWDPALIDDETFTLAVQVDGRLRARIQVRANTPEEAVRAQALQCEGVRRHLGDRSPARVIHVPGRLVNIVTQ
jgi:leucyl-tRNA synthetase